MQGAVGVVVPVGGLGTDGERRQDAVGGEDQRLVTVAGLRDGASWRTSPRRCRVLSVTSRSGGSGHGRADATGRAGGVQRTGFEHDGRPSDTRPGIPRDGDPGDGARPAAVAVAGGGDREAWNGGGGSSLRPPGRGPRRAAGSGRRPAGRSGSTASASVVNGLRSQAFRSSRTTLPRGVTFGPRQGLLDAADVRQGTEVDEVLAGLLTVLVGHPGPGRGADQVGRDVAEAGQLERLVGAALDQLHRRRVVRSTSR